MIKLRKEKRALSPLIVTVLLVMVGFALASTIFIWARGFIGEQVSKFNKPIEDSCVDVRMTGVTSGDSITISNNGNIPLYKVGVRITATSGNSEIKYTKVNLFQGSSLTITPGGTLAGNKIDLIPVLLGRTSRGSSAEFICLNNAVEIA